MDRAKLCECCGKCTIESGAYEICPLCGWEDDDYQNEYPDYAPGANKLSLNKHRKQYEQKLKENPDYIWEDEAIELYKKLIKK
jgi:hypothetical protein